MIEASELVTICVAAAEAGAHVLRERADRPRTIDFKGTIDLVTDADRASEEAVLKLLRERAPGVAVLAEESGAHAGSAGLRFIVDPLDGTTNYAHGIPLYACTVAAESRGAVLAGCTVDPSRGERFRAVRGGGAWLGRWGEPHEGERRLSVSNPASLARALVCTGFPYDNRERLDELLRTWSRFTARAQGTRRLGSAALDLSYVAAGRLDGFWEQGLKAWDVAAGDLLVTEAGGAVTRFDGSPHMLAGGEIVAAPPSLLKDLLAVLADRGD
jgi:myo-inositol-1(or 4)-monophosphatase